MVSQTSQILLEMITVCLNTSFESCSPLVNDPPRSAGTHDMSQLAAVATRLIIIIIIITDLYSAFRSEDTEALDAAQED